MSQVKQEWKQMGLKETRMGNRGWMSHVTGKWKGAGLREIGNGGVRSNSNGKGWAKGNRDGK